MKPVFGRKGPENSLVPLGSGPRFSMSNLQNLCMNEQRELETEFGFNGERSALRAISDAEFDLARGGNRTTLDADIFVETVSQVWCLHRRSAYAAFRAAVPGGTIQGQMDRHQYLLLREAFVHGENGDHPVIKKLRLTAIWHRADIDHDGLITQEELTDWLRDLCSGHGHVCRIAKDLFSEWQPCHPSSSRMSTATSAGPDSPPGGIPIEEAVRFLEEGSLEERLARCDPHHDPHYDPHHDPHGSPAPRP